MAKSNWLIFRIGIWWSIVVACVCALLFTSPISERVVISAAIPLGTGLTLAVFEHGWLKAPIPIGTLPRCVVILIFIWGSVGLLAYFVWPQKSVVFIKPGIWLNPYGPNPGWTFVVVVRGSQPVYNVKIELYDIDRNQKLMNAFQSTQSIAERAAISSEMSPIVLNYPELDPSTVEGSDREVDTVAISTGPRRSLSYKAAISFRGVDELEELEFKSPLDHVDWQIKMKMLWKNKTLIDCEDPRYQESTLSKAFRPQCFPEYEGKLSR